MAHDDCSGIVGYIDPNWPRPDDDGSACIIIFGSVVSEGIFCFLLTVSKICPIFRPGGPCGGPVYHCSSPPFMVPDSIPHLVFQYGRGRNSHGSHWIHLSYPRLQD